MALSSTDILDKVRDAVIQGDTKETVSGTNRALVAGLSANVILDKGIIPGLQEVGDLYGRGEYFLPELLISGDAALNALKLLEPLLSTSGTTSQGKFLIGTVEGDVHNIGKDIVLTMLKGNGWKVTDLGVDVPPEEFCSAIERGDFDILGLSSLLTTTMAKSVATIEGLKKAGLRGRVKIMVGGAPVTQEWADKIGADGYAKDAAMACKVAAVLLDKSQKEGRNAGT